jgi:hypothetical protein
MNQILAINKGHRSNWHVGIILFYIQMESVRETERFPVNWSVLGVFHTLLSAKNTLWARPCLSRFS